MLTLATPGYRCRCWHGPALRLASRGLSMSFICVPSDIFVILSVSCWYTCMICCFVMCILYLCIVMFVTFVIFLNFVKCYSGRRGSSCHQNQRNLCKKGYEDRLCRYIPRLTRLYFLLHAFYFSLFIVFTSEVEHWIRSSDRFYGPQTHDHGLTLSLPIYTTLSPYFF